MLAGALALMALSAEAARGSRRESGVNAQIVDRLEHLQTGTGTAQTTAISTAAITAVIFSLVDRFMASSKERKAEHHARASTVCLYTAWAFTL
jgi:hypothetical protein